MLWMILTLMTVLAAVGMAIPLIRRQDARSAGRLDTLGVLKAQLGELEAQAESGAIAETEAEALKSDLKRRVLAEGRTPEPPARALPERTLLILSVAIVAVVTLAGTGLYLAIGRPNVKAAPGAAVVASEPAGAHPQGETAAMIAQLETQMAQRPDNAEGWRMLGWSYLQTGRNAEAAVAYGKAVALDPTNNEYLSAQGESTVLAADGQVTPAAEALFRRAVAAEPGDPRARYYLAVAKDQRGDSVGAMDDWIALLKSAPPGAPWAPEVRTFVEKVAADRKLNISSRLPPIAGDPPDAASAQPGPSREQMAAAQTMKPAERDAMIQGMVDGLAAKLKQNPRDRSGWERLLRARMVLGQADKAAADYRAARQAFSGSPGDQQALRDTALQLGLPGA
jgi:cytochrome c-type biogenesis protein CcmH